ncbi:MAG TPA: hypothetical protein VH502_11630, partial [Actinoplanes sp.]
MAFPAGYTLVTVNAQIDDFPGGGSSGTARFTSAPAAMVGGADDSIVPQIDISESFTDGSFSVDLPATNDPDWSPTGWAYTVHIQLGSRDIRGSLQLDYQTTTVSLADLLQVDGTVATGQTYIPLSQRSVAGGVAGLDEDGDVIDASGTKITGGEGGGAAPGSTVVSETSFGQSATAGTGTAYSRATHSHGTPAAPTAASVGADASGTAAAAVAAHSADTTAVHGIADTADLVLTGDSRLSDARTPTAHASSHADGGSDEVSVAASQ